jgi:hypothetical protein
MSKLRESLKKDRKNTKEVAKLVDQLHDDEEVFKTSIHYPLALYKQMKVKCALEGITLREYVIGLIENDLLR